MNRLSEFMSEYDFGEGDEFWLVCDTDHWIAPNHIQNLVEVIKLCRQKNVGVALSNPCFELWLLLHFAEFPSEEDPSCAEISSSIRETVGQYNKKRIYDLPITAKEVSDAITRSKANQPTSGDIPSSTQTTVHRIVEDLIVRGEILIRG
jgi:hypothetical protein